MALMNMRLPEDKLLVAVNFTHWPGNERLF